jgi:hypothetical protein
LWGELGAMLLIVGRTMSAIAAGSRDPQEIGGVCCFGGSGCSRIKTEWVRRPPIDLLPAEQRRRNPSSIFALPTGIGINRPMGIAALNAILQKPHITAP